MGGFVQALEGYLNQYGYPILFLVIFVESFGIPAPGQTLLITAALFAATGNLHLWLVLVVAFAAATLGDNIGYLIGRKGGHTLLFRYAKRFGVSQERMEKVFDRFNRHGGWFVSFARFFDVLRQINGLIAGSTEMSFRRFLFFNSIGAALWVAAWGFGSYYLGQGLKQWLGQYEHIATWLIVGVIILCVIVIAVWLLRRAQQRRASKNENA
ncbi:MAG: DedA family protein [Gammaproteobacteria bacterium]